MACYYFMLDSIFYLNFEKKMSSAAYRIKHNMV